MSNLHYIMLGEINFECHLTVRPSQSIGGRINSLLDAMNNAKTAQLHLTDDDGNLTMVNLTILDADSQDVGQV
jgi:hypothetical protein